MLRALLILATLAAPAVAGPASETTRDHRRDDSPRVYRKRPGPRLMMPLKIDLGAAGVNTTRGWANGIGGAVGIHWASLSPKPTNFDIGLGLFGALLAAPADPMMESDAVAYGGAYLEVGHTLSRGSWWRTWASGRGEYLGSTAFGEDSVGFGATGRLTAELYVSGVGIAPRGVFLGTYAIGVYLETGARDVANNLGEFHVGGGLTFRTPLVFAL